MSAHSQEARKPAPEDRVPFKEKVAYAVGGITGALGINLDNGLIRPIFVLTLGISPALLSLCDVIYRIWDGLTDVLMGQVSDNTRSRWGRRRPYLVAGSVLCGLAMPVLWMFNPTWSTNAIIAWMIGSQLLLFLCFTIWNIPYQSLLLEMTPSSVERTNVLAVRGYVMWLPWLIIGWAWPLAQLPFFNDPSGSPNILRGALWVTVGMSIVVIACGVLPGLFCRERFYQQAVKQEKVPLLKTMRLTLTNRVFLCLVGTILFMTIGTAGTEGLGFFVKLYHVFDGDQKAAAAFGGITHTMGLVLGVATVPLKQWSARRYGKRFTLMVALALFLVSSLSTWFTYDPDRPYLIIFNSLVGSLANGLLWFMVPSMLGDVVDYDELVTGARREGAFSAAFSWTFKVSGSLGAASSGFLVELLGFDAKLGLQQPEGVILSMRIGLIILPIVGLGAALAFMSFYPLTSRRIEEVREELEARRGKL